MKILVTGATGYLGAEIVRTLLKGGEHTVIALCRDLGKLDRLRQWSHAQENCLQTLQGDLRGLDALPGGIEAIIHAGALRGPECEKKASEAIQVNIQGTCRLLRLAVLHGIQRFIYVSSQSVYGKQPPPWHERMDPDPQGVYAITKYAAERLVQDFHGDTEFVILRLSSIYGVSLFMHWDEFFGKLVRLMYEGRSVPVYGDGTQRIDLVHVCDVAECVARLVELYPRGWNEVYNVGGGGSISLNELVEHLAQIARTLNLPSVIVENHPEATSASSRHLELDISHLQANLAWKPRRSLEYSVREYFSTYSHLERDPSWGKE